MSHAIPIENVRGHSAFHGGWLATWKTAMVPSVVPGPTDAESVVSATDGSMAAGPQ